MIYITIFLVILDNLTVPDTKQSGVKFVLGIKCLIGEQFRRSFATVRDSSEKIQQEIRSASYKKTGANTLNDINREAKHIASDLGISDRTMSFPKNQAFITLKDHKENFENAPKCRLINPAKSILGRVSKQILESLNEATKRSTMVNQWKNTKCVIDWFKALTNKRTCTFIPFDIVDFYPSITEELLAKSINHAKQHTTISNKDLEVIMHARKSLLFDKDETWMKKVRRSGSLRAGRNLYIINPK